MITVAGFNTAIDHLFTVDTLEPGQVQRASRSEPYPGGKGLHVAQAIAALGERVQLVGLTDAAHRNLIARRLAERGVLFHGVEIEAPLRRCMAVRERDGRVTEILGPGPELTEASCQELLDTWARCAGESELLVLSGSLPGGLDPSTYARLIEQARPNAVPCLVDASGDALRAAAVGRPWLLKPNRDEAADLIGEPIDTVADAARVARELHMRGVALPLVTLGAQGAVGWDGQHAWHAAVTVAHNVNAVGSGDCLLAGLAVALHRRALLPEALRLGVACGAANAMNEETGFLRRDQVDALLGEVRLTRLAG
ncbi:1-phosphofructokinase family hexose kinase [Dyella sp.]|uniref:1-phosphofructokinase family hexose kinase n=1 Tax=Dyella sp. TaxID=1869338 RepID=UPI003F7F46B7